MDRTRSLLIFSALGVAFGVWWVAERLAPVRPEVFLDEAIARSSGYLERHCDDNGRFTYATNLKEGVVPDPDGPRLAKNSRSSTTLAACLTCLDHRSPRWT